MNTSLLLVAVILGNEQGELPSLDEQRAATRVRLVIGGGATAAAGSVSMIAPSLHFEVGAMLNDRFAVGGMLDVGTLFFGASTLLVGANAMWILTEWLALGAGVAVSHLGATGWEEYGAGQALLLPLRVDVAIPVRGPRQVKRHGLALTLMAAPGSIRVSNSRSRSVPAGAIAFQFVGGLGLAYALW